MRWFGAVLKPDHTPTVASRIDLGGYHTGRFLQCVFDMDGTSRAVHSINDDGRLPGSGWR